MGGYYTLGDHCQNALSTEQDRVTLSPHEGEHPGEWNRSLSRQAGEPASIKQMTRVLRVNTTANDLGLQSFLDAEGWRRVAITDPRRHQIVQILAEGPLARLGITELRFESAEPSPAEVLAMFRPGDYEFRGRTADGDLLVSEATLSHDFLPAPTFTPANGQVVNPSNTVVTWTAPGAERVEVILENVELGHLLDVTVAGSITSLNVPPQFLQPNREYRIETLAISANGNRTIAESTFRTMP